MVLERGAFLGWVPEDVFLKILRDLLFDNFMRFFKGLPPFFDYVKIKGRKSFIFKYLSVGVIRSRNVYALGGDRGGLRPAIATMSPAVGSCAARLLSGL